MTDSVFAPVPYVFLASPLLTHPWPSSAALGRCKQEAIFTLKGNFCLPAGLLQLPRCQDPSKGHWLDFQNWRRTPDQDYFEVILTGYILLPINCTRFAHIIIRSHAYCSCIMFGSFLPPSATSSYTQETQGNLPNRWTVPVGRARATWILGRWMPVGSWKNSRSS